MKNVASVCFIAQSSRSLLSENEPWHHLPTTTGGVGMVGTVKSKKIEKHSARGPSSNRRKWDCAWRVCGFVRTVWEILGWMRLMIFNEDIMHISKLHWVVVSGFLIASGRSPLRQSSLWLMWLGMGSGAAPPRHETAEVFSPRYSFLIRKTQGWGALPWPRVPSLKFWKFLWLSPFWPTNGIGRCVQSRPLHLGCMTWPGICRTHEADLEQGPSPPLVTKYLPLQDGQNNGRTLDRMSSPQTGSWACGVSWVGLRNQSSNNNSNISIVCMKLIIPCKCCLDPYLLWTRVKFSQTCPRENPYPQTLLNLGDLDLQLPSVSIWFLSDWLNSLVC